VVADVDERWRQSVQPYAARSTPSSSAVIRLLST
jgi:hypothetical protein